MIIKLPSGITEIIGNRTHHLRRSGGYLSYGQIFNGEIAAYFMYPYIEGYSEMLNIKEIGIFKPHLLEADLINKHTIMFLDEMQLWQKRSKMLDHGKLIRSIDYHVTD